MLSAEIAITDMCIQRLNNGRERRRVLTWNFLQMLLNTSAPTDRLNNIVIIIKKYDKFDIKTSIINF